MTVTLTREGEAALVTLTRPEALNALSFAIIGELGSAPRWDGSFWEYLQPPP